jgi:hypothetical protein
VKIIITKLNNNNKNKNKNKKKRCHLSCSSVFPPTQKKEKIFETGRKKKRPLTFSRFLLLTPFPALFVQ